MTYIPGIPSIRVQDLPRLSFDGIGRKMLDQAKDSVSMACKGKCLVINSIQELESQTMEALKQQFPSEIPVYSIGPPIPYFKPDKRRRRQNHDNNIDYIAWLDTQPRDSVLYISQGSFLSSSAEELKEIVGGVLDSDVRFLMVARDVDELLLLFGDSGKGLVVPWCDQLEVLCHPSVGGFWSHCGWNSTQEGAYAGIPFLTSPLIWDQFTNSKKIVEDWKMGWKLVLPATATAMRRQQISSVLKRFMDSESDGGGKEIRRNAKYVREICLRATETEGGSAQFAIQAFIDTVLK